MDEKTGEALEISKPIPLPALNIKYSFAAYQKSQEQIDKTRETINDPKWRPPPLAIVNAMVSHGRVELLAHPLSQKYLQMKWNAYGKYFHVTNLLLYSVYLIFITIFASQLMSNISDIIDDKLQNATLNLNLTEVQQIDPNYVSLTPSHSHASTPTSLYQRKLIATANKLNQTIVMNQQQLNATSVMMISGTAIVVYIAINLLREFFQIYHQKWHYLFEPNNLISWLLHISAVIMVLPIFNDGNVTDVHLTAASITVFLSWFNLLLFLQRFDQVGIYVVMFLEILQTLIKVLAVFSILIIAFGLSFYILMSKITNTRSTNHLSFSTIPMSLMRTFSMMLGELDFVGTYVQPYYIGELPFPLPAFILLCLFMVLMPILLMNLLIGLAVGDIESVRRNAQLKRLAMQVVLHTELEQKLPQMWLEKVDKMELIEFPNDTKLKLGFFDSILRRWFSNPFTDDSCVDMVLENNEDFLTLEMSKQKSKLKNISKTLDAQHQLLRLIIQKMEIKSEADDVDEGTPLSLGKPCTQNSSKNSRWTSPGIQKKLKHGLSFNKNCK